MNLDNRIKELIAIGASVTANCQPCLEYHVSKALENGANEQEIATAIEVGKLVRKGAAGKLDKFAFTLNLDKRNVSAAKASDEACGCVS